MRRGTGHPGLKDDGFFRDRFGGTAACRTPWQVLGFLNGTMAAAWHNRDTGRWEDACRAGRSDMTLVHSLRDTRLLRTVAVRTLVLHDELGLVKQPTCCVGQIAGHGRDNFLASSV